MWETTGFRIIPGIFDEEEVDRLRDAVLAGAEHRTRGGARHLLHLPEVAAVAQDPRLIEIARECLGAAPLVYRASLFNKSPAANWGVLWHQDKSLPMQQRFDAPGWGPWSIKAGVLFVQAPADALARVVALRLHLDDSTMTNGPLRVLPGSHQSGLLSQEEMDILARRGPVVHCLVSAGGVVALRPLLAHSSPKAQDANPRRVLHFEYSDSRIHGPGIELAVA